MKDYPDFIESTGYGRVDGLCGANCRHDFFAFIPGVSIRTYTDEQLDEMNARENTPKTYGGKEYTTYQATQRQRQLERQMRAQRQEIQLLQLGDADEDDIIQARCRYRNYSQEYTAFSEAMGLPQQRERVTIDGLGNIGQGKWKIVDKKEKSGIINIDGFIVNQKQFGKKIRKHAADYGVDPSTQEGRNQMLNIIHDIRRNATEIREGPWRGQENDVVFYIKDDDVVVTNSKGEFITVLKGGIENARVKNARKREV